MIWQKALLTYLVTSSKDQQLGLTSAVGVERRHVIAGALAAVTWMMPKDGASAKDDRLFKPNPLTNPVLEQIRIWDQAEADMIKYGGELERGDAKMVAYSRLLVPILRMSQELDQVQTLIDSKEWKRAKEILSDSKYDTIPFKKTFNQFADNIYFSDPDRANLYLGGGATPKPTQSLAYLLRNDILTNVQDMRAELDFLVSSSSSEDSDIVDLCRNANQAMKEYVDLVPPEERREAESVLTR